MPVSCRCSFKWKIVTVFPGSCHSKFTWMFFLFRLCFYLFLLKWLIIRVLFRVVETLSVHFQSFPHLAVETSPSQESYLLWVSRLPGTVPGKCGVVTPWRFVLRALGRVCWFQPSSASSCCVYGMFPSFSFLLGIKRLIHSCENCAITDR